MPQPGTLYNTAALEQFLIKRAPGNFAAPFIAPTVMSAKLTGTIWSSDTTREDLIARDTNRAAGAYPNKVDVLPPTSVSYTVKDHSLEGDLTDEEREQVESALESEINTVAGIQDRLRLAREVALVTALAAGLTGGNTSSPTNKWNSAAGDIFSDISAQMTTIEDNVGIAPDAMVIGSDVIRKASMAAAWRDRLKNTIAPASEAAMPLESVLAAALRIPVGNIFVVTNYQNTAALGNTASLSRIWGENVLLFRREQPSFRFNGLMIQVRWTGSGTGFEVTSERAARAKKDIISVHDYYTDKLVNAGAGHWFTNTLA